MVDFAMIIFSTSITFLTTLLSDFCLYIVFFSVNVAHKNITYGVII